MKFLLLLALLAYVAQGNIEIQVIQKVCMGGNCDEDDNDSPSSSLEKAQESLAKAEQELKKLETALADAMESADAVADANNATANLVDAADGGINRRHRRQTSSNLTLTSCEPSGTIEGSPLDVTLQVVQGILSELQTIATTLNADKLNCYIKLAENLTAGLQDGSIPDITGDLTALKQLANQVNNATQASLESITQAAAQLKTDLEAKKQEIQILQQQVQNLGGSAPGTVLEVPPTPEEIPVTNPPRLPPATGTESHVIAFTPGGPDAGGHGMAGDAAFVDKEMCADVLCAEPPGEDCVLTAVDYGCCGNWICGDTPRNCTSDNGTVYQIYASWNEGNCLHCYCWFSSFSGAQKSCYSSVYCPPSPHRDCISQGVEEGACCENYFCDNTTCLSEKVYHSLGEIWQLSSDPCQTCECRKGEIPEIICNSTADQCQPAPGPGCRPLVFSDECCPHDWDCSDEYLITMPKKWIRNQESSVCVFTTSEDDPVNINLSFDLEDKANSKAQAALQKDAVGGTYVCVNLTVPADMSSTGTLSVSGQVGTANISKNLQVGIASVGQTFVQTDKFLYMPGQVVQFRILTIITTRALISYENVSEVWIVSPGGSRLAQWTNVDNSVGLIQLQFPLANEVEEGEYKIFVETEGSQVSQVFKVEKYVLPRFSVTIQPPPYVLRTDTEIVFHVCAQYTYGQPVTGTLLLSLKKETYYWYYWMDYNEPQDNLISKNETLTGCTDISISTSNIGYIWQPLIATATFTEEGTGIEMTASITLSVSGNAVQLEQMTTERYHKPGLPYPVQVKAKRPDGSAAAGELMSVCAKSSCKEYTSDENGIVTAVIPPQLMTEPLTGIQINEVNATTKNGPMGSTYPYSTYLSVKSYYSPSSSGLSLSLIDDSLRCGQETDTASLPVFFVANETDSAEIWIQLISRSQIIWTDSMEVNFEASDLPINESQLLEPILPLSVGLVRGSFNINFPLTSLSSPTLSILVWYSRNDGEVVSTSARIDVGKCLSNPTNIAWNTASTIPAPKDAATITISSSPNSVCGLDVVDRSVELLSRSQPGKLSVGAIFNAMSNADVQEYEYSQIDDSYYCYGNEDFSYDYGVFPVGIAVKKKRSKYYYGGGGGSSYVDAIKSFEVAGLLVVSDLTLETRPCEPLPSYSYGYGGGPVLEGGDYMYAMAVPELPVMKEPQASIQSDTAGDQVADSVAGKKNEERSYFPETWLWKLVVISENGATIENVELPDTITEWVGEAVCAHPQLGVGLSAPSSITTFTPFFLDLSMPPVARRGENVPILVSVFNYFGQNLPVSVSLHESSEYSSVLNDTQVCVEADGKSVVTFVVTPLQVGKINLTVSAHINTLDEECGGGAGINKSDVVIKPLTVQFEGVMKENTYSDYICSGDGTVSWYVETPEDIIADSERVHVSVSADLLGPTIENLGHLIRMPYGCGEQNMLNFAPNIFILQYLEASDQSTPAIIQMAKDYMVAGYQQELTYRRTDGSYSAFGNQDSEGSTWLTAFVLKSFAHAAEYIMVDQNDLQVSKDWLLSLQEKNGCFRSVGNVIHKDMEGGLDPSSNTLAPLTAYVLISLLETNQSINSGSINDAIGCIQTDSSSNTYINALKAYAFALASNIGTGPLIDAVYTELTSGTSGLSEPVLVEAAGYLLLAMIKANPSSYVAQTITIAKLISSRRNGQGGFVSTQDTVVALQALATFSEAYPPSDTSLNLNVSAGQQNLIFSVSSANRLLLQSQDIDLSTPYNITVSASGEGCAVVMVVQRYNVPEETESSAFDMSLEVATKNCTSGAEVNICFSYLLDDGGSNMAILNIVPVTGFTVVTSDLEDLQNAGTIKRFEEDEGSVNLYLESVAPEETCISISVERNFNVENAKPGSVTLYDYYQPSQRITKSLQISSDCVE